MLAPWKKSYDQPRQHIKKQRHYFANKGLSSHSYGFSSSLYVCESWMIKTAVQWRTDAFEPWCWRRLLRIPWTARRSNQSILKEINPEHSFVGRTGAEAEAPVWPPATKNWLIGKDPDAEKDWRQKKGTQRMRWLDGITESMDRTLSNEQGFMSSPGAGEQQGSLVCCSQ